MTENGINFFDNYSEEQKQLFNHIVGLEKAALDKWFKGDTSGYRALWSKKNFTYFDGAFPTRVDEYATISQFLDGIEGKLFADSYDFVSPRIQFNGDIAILTYQLFSDTSLIDMKYNVIEIFEKEEGEWKVIHSTWSFIRPMDQDFSKLKQMV